MGDLQPVVEALGIHKVFGDLEVLKGIDLKVTQQELVFIIGPSGSGKSTLLRCCNLLEQPTHGTVRVAGEEITAKGVDINKIRQHIGMVFQNFNLYPHMSALANVTLALRKVKSVPRAQATHQHTPHISPHHTPHTTHTSPYMPYHKQKVLTVAAQQTCGWIHPKNL